MNKVGQKYHLASAGTTVSDNNFPSAFPVTNRFSSLSVEYASLDPEDAVPQDVGVEDSHIQFTFASSQGAVTTENIGPTDFELLEEAIAVVAEQKTSHLVTTAPPDTVNSPLVVTDGIASETLCDGQPHDLRHSNYRAHYPLELPLYHPPTASSRPLALSGPDLSVYELTSDFNATHYSNDYHPLISSFNPLVPISSHFSPFTLYSSFPTMPSISLPT